jgi:hypothetical protein
MKYSDEGVIKWGIVRRKPLAPNPNPQFLLLKKNSNTL